MKEIIEHMENEGWYLARVKSYHHQFKNPGRKGRGTVPHPKSNVSGLGYSFDRGWGLV